MDTIFLKAVRILLFFLNVIVALFRIYVSPGISSPAIPPQTRLFIKRGLRRLLADNPDIPHTVFKVLARNFNQSATTNNLSSVIDSESTRMHSLYAYLDKSDCVFSSYFSIYLPKIEEEILNDVVADLRNTYRGDVPILIIGGCGFLGSHLAVLLGNLGALSVDLLDIRNPSSLLNDKAPSFAARAIKMDITDLNALKAFLNDKTYKYIFNFASNQTDPLGRQNPAETISINVDGLLNIVTAVECSESLSDNLRCFVHASTDKVLSMQEVFQENRWEHLEKKISTYDASKLAGDTLALIQSRIVDVPFCIVRLCNIIGPYDDNDRFRYIPKEVLRMVSENKPPEYYSDSANDWREYLYVDDACRILLQVAKTRQLVHKVSTLPGCYYERTDRVAQKMLDVYNNRNNASRKIRGSPQAISLEASQRRIAMIQNKERASAMDMLSVEPNIGYHYSFEEGIEQIIKYNEGKSI